MSNKPTLKQIIKAVAGAFIGVQSEQQRQQDFNSQSPLPYIIVGVVMTMLFVIGLITIVSLVLS
ncbi:DUF2970 domain-containing protein [Rheinheimera riviphila]|uniref:DUF2970 domain-containing protein n=1 Tax=Rheinheimera riviphila TaxID=1834037 RepID=A0A437R0P5_9GAMM|nr:DUF2970 domain-containing protein [Rheinheimera riviphila]RVU40356.1 DUF2970 domain-containing protein [Rheinheimera riviphila]